MSQIVRLTPDRVQELLAKPGAVLKGHFVGQSGKHLDTYVAKDRATRLPSVASELCQGAAGIFADDEIQAVVSPAIGGVALAQWTAHHLFLLNLNKPEVLALYAEHREELLTDSSPTLQKREPKTVKIYPDFILKRGFADDVKGKRTLVVEDILTTGASARNTARAVVEAGGILVAVAALVNGGNITAADVEAERLETLLTLQRRVLTEADCIALGMCAEDIKIDIEFGHGKTYLARKTAEARSI